MRISELQAGEIDHALALAIPQTRAATFVFPAQRSDGNYTGPNAIPEGTRFRISPTVDVTKLGLSRVGLIMARAAQRYGIVVRDQSGSVTFQERTRLSTARRIPTEPCSAANIRTRSSRSFLGAACRSFNRGMTGGLVR